MPERFESLEAAAEFWDTHSTADYDEYFTDVADVVVNIKYRREYIPIAHDLGKSLNEIARQQGVSRETLINLWLQEKLRDYIELYPNTLKSAGSALDAAA